MQFNTFIYMNYYQKYLKYKTKYLNFLKGGTVPHIDCDLLPFEKTNINISINMHLQNHKLH